MLLIPPGADGATPRSRRSEHRSADADFAATARTGALANAAQPLPEPPNFEDTTAGAWIFRVLCVGSVLTAAWQFGWLK
ncbi:MAG: hypothetical protein ACTHJ9_05355 [Rhodanobacter sp.]